MDSFTGCPKEARFCGTWEPCIKGKKNRDQGTHLRESTNEVKGR